MFKTLNKQLHPWMQDMFSARVFCYNICRSENKYLNQRMTISSEGMGIQRLSFRMYCHPNYVSH